MVWEGVRLSSAYRMVEGKRDWGCRLPKVSVSLTLLVFAKEQGDRALCICPPIIPWLAHVAIMLSTAKNLAEIINHRIEQGFHEVESLDAVDHCIRVHAHFRPRGISPSGWLCGGYFIAPSVDVVMFEFPQNRWMFTKICVPGHHRGRSSQVEAGGWC
jgi:hypothetical protein